MQVPDPLTPELRGEINGDARSFEIIGSVALAWKFTTPALDFMCASAIRVPLGFHDHLIGQKFQIVHETLRSFCR
jgi:hypothetical protein